MLAQAEKIRQLLNIKHFDTVFTHGLIPNKGYLKCQVVGNDCDIKLSLCRFTKKTVSAYMRPLEMLLFSKN